MEPAGSLPFTQEPAPCPYPAPYKPVHAHPPIPLRSTVTLSSVLRLGLQCGLSPSGFPTKTLSALLLFPKCAISSAHRIFLPGYTLPVSEFVQWKL